MSVAQIVADQFQFDCAPQSPPRTRVHPVYKHAPKLREECLHSLSQATDQCFMTTSVSRSYQQRLRFICQLFSNPFASIAVVCKRYSTLCHKCQFKRRFSITRIACCKETTNEMAVNIDRSVQLKAKEPSFAALSKVSSFFSQQSHAAMPNWVTHGYRLRVIYRQVHFKAVRIAGRLYKMTRNFTQSMEPSNPLLIR